MRQFDRVSKSILIVAASALTLAGCSQEEQASSDVAAGGAVSTEEAPAEMPATDAGGNSSELAPLAERAAIPVIMPSMAYIYDYGFSLPVAEIAPLQTRHADMCEALGPSQCMIVGMTTSGASEDEASGRLEMAVASDRARRFVSEMGALAEAFHGEQVSGNVTGEDLSKSLVDTEARLRARTELRDRLLEVLQTRHGTVAELVEAERNVAMIYEEIDQARSWMAEMQGRVSYSRVVMTYQSATPLAGDFLDPVRAALGSLGSILGITLAIAIVLGAVGGPIAGGIIAARWLRRRLGVKAVAEG